MILNENVCNEKFLQENEMIDNKRLKYNDISIETNVPAVVVEKQEDCIIVSHVNKQNLTADDIDAKKF